MVDRLVFLNFVIEGRMKILANNNLGKWGGWPPLSPPPPPVPTPMLFCWKLFTILTNEFHVNNLNQPEQQNSEQKRVFNARVYHAAPPDWKVARTDSGSKAGPLILIWTFWT